MLPQTEVLYEMHNLCIPQLEKVRDNLYTLLNSNWPEAQKVNLMTTVDAYISSLIDVSNLSRKFTMQLMLGNKNNKNNFQTLLDNLQENGHTKQKQITLPAIEAGRSVVSEEVTDSESDGDKSSCGTQDSIDLSKYTSGYILKASVTSIKDLMELSFYAWDRNSAAMPTLKKLSCSPHLRQFTGLPPKNEIFGLVLEEKIVRALLYETQSSTNNRSKKSTYTVQLIDFGDVLDVDLNYITYHLLPEHKRIPPQALFCHLHSIESHNELSQNQMKQKELKELLYETSTFEVVSVNNGVLELKLLQRKSENQPLEAFKSEEQHAVAPPEVKKQETPLVKSRPKKIQTNPFLSCSEDSSASNESDKLLPLKQLDRSIVPKGLSQLNGLTPDEWEMLYEEPACTSNAMKAVHGYNPKDDKRLCRFYDAKTGNCFKGSSCRLEHTPLLPNGWTKDKVPAASIVYERNPTIRYSGGEIISITPTCVDHMHNFYAQINNPKELMTPLLWDDNEVPRWKRMNQMPLMYDVVLAKYEDGKWYRARVVEAEHASKEVEVFYIDYGNQQRVPLRDCARCDDDVAHLPSQADLFFISDVRDCQKSQEKRKIAVNMLRQAILNQKVNVVVVSQYEDITIRFIDKPIIEMVDRMKKLFI